MWGFKLGIRSSAPGTALTGALVAVLAAAGCAPASEADGATLTVLAAASLSEAFRALGAAYEEGHGGVTTAFSFAGSQQLATQILEGAPADVFASANAAQMERVVEGGLVAPQAVATFATNRLVIVRPADGAARVAAPADLALPGLKLVLAARDVPAGKYALEFLAKASVPSELGPEFGPAVLANVASYEDDVQAVLAKVALGEADAGIVYASDASSRVADRVVFVPIPEALDVVAAYPIGPLAGSILRDHAADFVDFVRSPEGQAILAEHGFGGAPATTTGTVP